MLAVYVDADGCPVRDEVYRVARRYELQVFVVSNRRIGVPTEDRIQSVVVDDAFDAADDWIAERIDEGDIVVTADLLLSERCLQAGARVLSPKGRELDEETIGSALATRKLMEELRQMGEITPGPAPMAKRDRSQFLSELDRLVQAQRRRPPRLPS